MFNLLCLKTEVNVRIICFCDWILCSHVFFVLGENTFSNDWDTARLILVLLPKLKLKNNTFSNETPAKLVLAGKLRQA
jgi:hypothetical protein